MKRILVLLLSFIFVFSIFASGCGNPCKKGHSYGAWTVSNVATCTENGQVVRYCLRDGCGHKEIASVAKLGHKFDFVEQREATCYLQACDSHYYCSKCEKIFDLDKNLADESIIFKGYASHNLRDGKLIIVKPSGQNVEGIAHHRCKDFDKCGYFSVIPLEANTGSDDGLNGEWTEPPV